MPRKLIKYKWSTSFTRDICNVCKKRTIHVVNLVQEDNERAYRIVLCKRCLVIAQGIIQLTRERENNE